MDAVQGSLNDRFDRLNLAPGAQPPTGNSGGLEVPEGGVRKQRSQRFTVPTSSPRGPSSTQPLPSFAPSLPYQPPPPPVQTQSIPPSLSFLADPAPAPPVQTNFYSTSGRREYSSSASSSSGGESPSPLYSVAPGVQQQQQQYGAYRPHSQADFLAPSGGSAAGSGFLAPGMGGRGGSPYGSSQGSQMSAGSAGSGKVVNEDGDEIIETAIVIKSIPFAATKEQVLALMASLSLPPPFAFNFHHDAVTGAFRGLAFANFRSAAEAGMVVAALEGFEFMGRKLRAEFKRALKPGEKEAIEREKALKRMRSAQLLAGSAHPYTAGSTYGAGDSLGPPAGWNRREASAPGGYPGFHAPPPPPVPVVPMQYQQYGHPQRQHSHHQHGQEQEEEDYGRPLLNGPFSTLAPAGDVPALSVHSAVPARFGSRDFVPAPIPGAAAAPMEPSYSSSPPSSDVGTSVSQRMGGGTANTSMSEGEEGSTVSVERRAGRDELDLNDPLTLDIYSRVLLFRDDALRDELAFARSLSTSQRRVVHLVAKKLGLEHKSVGEGEERRVVVVKGGRKLRHSASTASISLRRPSRGDLNSPSPARTGGYVPPLPHSSYLSPSVSSSSLSTLATSAAGLRGKKSMPDIRYTRDGHILPSSSLSGAHYPSSAASSRSASPAPPPLPQSTSLSANLAAYSAGQGYASQSGSLRGDAAYSTPQVRRSTANLREGYATIAGVPSSSSASHATWGTPTRSSRRETPSVLGLFQQQGISPSSPSGGEGGGKSVFWASGDGGKGTPGKADPIRQPRGPSEASANGGGGEREGMEWRRRV
ncbi:hypothetical protein JCM10213_008971 [Rhodosporidiobolus nylandii]